MNAPRKKTQIPIDDLLKGAEWWDHSGAVNIEKTEKEKWIKELIETAKQEPERDMWYTTSGNCLILLHRTGPDTFDVMDLEPKRTTYLETTTPCMCPTSVLLRAGCLCAV